MFGNCYQSKYTLDRPKKPPASVEEERQDFYARRGGSCGKWLWACRQCNGCGTVWDPHDPGCPIEGNKNRDRIKCPNCGGTGEGTKEEYRKALIVRRSEYKTSMAAYRGQQALIRSIRKKLNKAEREFLNI